MEQIQSTNVFNTAAAFMLKPYEEEWEGNRGAWKELGEGDGGH